ncbi:MAG: pilus assembly PilX N-terminal domain-containing protein [Candidatus Magnetomorum sp.]|nr:pilus assembly PilX N-terminal domain-containing protein [Candidatus Magnetomorum sp.]
MTQNNGNITVLALMLLAIMTLFTIASFHESSTEVLVVSNDLSTSKSFYCAEATVVEVSNALESASIDDLKEVMSDKSGIYSGRTLNWVHASTQSPDLTISTNWQKATEILTSTNQCKDAEYIAIQNIYTQGDTLRNESLDMNKSGDQVHEYTLIARSTDGGGEATIEIGYRRRF